MNTHSQKRRIFIDLRYLKYLTNGFGQLSLAYANYFKNNPDKYNDLDITLYVPKEYVGKFGSHVKYIKVNKIFKILPFLLPSFDISHSITQQIKYTPIGNKVFRIVTIHDLNFLYEKGHSGAKKRLKRTQDRINLADFVTVISKFTQNEIENNLEIKDTPVILNYVGTKDISKNPEKKPIFINSERKYFFTIGQVLAKKNFHVLLDMMKLMPEYDLYICGDDKDKYAQQIKERLANEDISNVFLTGIISPEERIWMYRNCYAFVFPSKFEGFGMPIIEAMLFEKPVFSSRLTSLDEIGDKYAFFWDNFDPEYMKNIIDQNLVSFYNNPGFIKKQKEYASSYSLESHIERYLNLYRSIELNKRSNIINSIKNYIYLMKA